MLTTIRPLLLCLLILGLTACQKSPADMSKSEVEAQLGKSGELKEISLTEKSGGGGFTGTAKGKDGSPYKIDVVQDKQARKLSYKAESASGDELTGSLESK